jgi:thioredoxin reductase (NADPH)
MYEVAIIGGGPAGLTAAIYAVRYKMKAITISPEWGGYTNYAHKVENWPSENTISGIELGKKFLDHAKFLNAELITANVQAINKTKKGFEVITQKDRYEAERIIITSGTERTKLGVEGENEFLGKGVSYCATCDGFFFKNKDVAVIGSGDSACTSAVYLADIANKVYLMYRSSKLKAEPIWIDKVENNPKIELLPTTMPVRIEGDKVVKKVYCDDTKELKVDGVFIEIGSTPSKFLIKKLGVKTDDKGYIVVDGNQKTNIDKVWAAGDITTNSSKFKQIVTAASEGAVAVFNAYVDAKS